MFELSLSGIWIVCYVSRHLVNLHCSVCCNGIEINKTGLSCIVIQHLWFSSVEICIAVTIPLKCFSQVSKFIRETFHVTDLVGTRNVKKLHVLVMHGGVTALRQRSKLVGFFLHVFDSCKALWSPVCPGMSATCLICVHSEVMFTWYVEMLHNFSKFFHSTWPHDKTHHLHFCINMFSRALLYAFCSQPSVKEFTTSASSNS